MGSIVTTQQLQSMANALRADVAKMTTEAGSGHPTSCFSCAEIMSVLFFDCMRLNPKNVHHAENDEFVLSKGHAAPILYAALSRAGAIKDDILTLRKKNSNLEGHPMPRSLAWAKVATGSLGQGLSIGSGMAYAATLQERKKRTYVLLGDSEMAEGSNAEAMQWASHANLKNITAIVDINRLGQTGATLYEHSIAKHKALWSAHGWEVFVVDGHAVNELRVALRHCQKAKKPTVILAKTFKGKGYKPVENKVGYHGKPFSTEELPHVLQAVQPINIPKLKPKAPHKVGRAKHAKKTLRLPEIKTYDMPIATRKAFGEALARVVHQNSQVIAVDAEVGNSTMTGLSKGAAADQFVQTYIAEQQLIGLSLGMATQGMLPVASTFAAFLTRAHDQLRMGAYSDQHIIVTGSHAGASIGEDGVSQMGLEDIAMARTLANATVLYPSDAVATQKLLYNACKHDGTVYIRTTRAATPSVYDPKATFPLGHFNCLHQSGKDKLVIAAAGITLHEAMKAHRMLLDEKIHVAIIDIYCIKPFDHHAFEGFVAQHGKQFLVVEDHFEEGGIGEMLGAKSKFTFGHLCVKGVPHSATPKELLHAHHLDAASIVKVARKMVKRL